MTASLNPYISKFEAGFDAERSSQYRMAIQFSLGGFSYALLDVATASIIGLECFQSDSLAGDGELFQALERALEAKNLNNRDFEAVCCLMDHRTSTLVPTSLFDEKEAASYLGFAFQVGNEQLVLSEPLKSVQGFNVFAASKALLANIRSKWPKAQVRHSGSVFIDGAVQGLMGDSTVFVNVRNQNYDMAIVEEGKLLFFNNFKFNTKEDFVYFLLLALEQNHLSGTDVSACFTGLMLPDAKIMELCNRYINEIRFVEVERIESLGETLREVPFQYYCLLYQVLRGEAQAV